MARILPAAAMGHWQTIRTAFLPTLFSKIHRRCNWSAAGRWLEKRHDRLGGRLPRAPSRRVSRTRLFLSKRAIVRWPALWWPTR